MGPRKKSKHPKEGRPVPGSPPRGDGRARQGGSLLRDLAALAAVLFAAAVLLAFSPLGQQLLGLVAPRSTDPLSAAIVDQTAAYDPNPEFVAAATEMLEGTGYVVDYYPPEQVTVDLYQELPAHGYDIIILRVHSGLIVEPDRTQAVGLGLFTSEPYSPAMHIDPELARFLAAGYYEEGGQRYVVISPGFIESAMRGSFNDATVILMGCNGLTSVNAAARPFFVRGADSFISWDDLISWSHSDAATERLLELMLIEGLDPEEAVKQTAVELGPDPVFGANLRILTPDG